MTSHTRILALFVIGVTIGPTFEAKATTYTITGVPGVTGTITTDGKLGIIGPESITAWAWSGYGVSQSGPFGNYPPTGSFASGNFLATDSTLSLTFNEAQEIVFLDYAVIVGHGVFPSFLDLQMISDSQLSVQVQPYRNIPPSTSFTIDTPTQSYVVATNVVPEPATIVLLLLGVALACLSKARGLRLGARRLEGFHGHPGDKKL